MILFLTTKITIMATAQIVITVLAAVVVNLARIIHVERLHLALHPVHQLRVIPAPLYVEQSVV